MTLPVIQQTGEIIDSTDYQESASIGKLAGAMAKAQAEMSNAKKDGKNPHFNSDFASLASVRDACLPALNKYGIAVFQPPASDDGATISVMTKLAHESGEWIASILRMRPVKADPQGAGSAITYARRYALAGMTVLGAGVLDPAGIAGIAPADDDGNAASRPRAENVVTIPAGFSEWVLDLEATADESTELLQQAWKASSTALRGHMTKHHAAKWKAIKAKAESR